MENGETVGPDWGLYVDEGLAHEATTVSPDWGQYVDEGPAHEATTVSAETRTV